MRVSNLEIKCSKNQAGLTLTELVITVTIIGILSMVAVAIFGNTHSKVQYETMLRNMVTDIRYAQQLAITDGKGTRVHIDEANNQYYLKWDDGTFIQRPVGGGDFVIRLGKGDFNAVQITGTAFTNGRLDFNRSGFPLNSGNAFSGTLNLVTLNSAKKIVVTANTGFLKIENY